MLFYTFSRFSNSNIGKVENVLFKRQSSFSDDYFETPVVRYADENSISIEMYSAVPLTSMFGNWNITR